MTDETPTWTELPSAPLCVADFRVEGPLISVGRTPFGDRRLGYVTGGAFRGERLSGEILPGGGNWSQGGELAPGLACGSFDARALWRTTDDALIYVTYTGRTAIPADVAAEFRDPAAEPVAPARYYIRIAPVFETSDPRYAWLNGVLAVGCGQRMPWGVRHYIFAIR